MKDRTDEFGQIDKSGWDKGQWHGEPDESTWTDIEAGYKVHIKRDPDTGSLGYAVGIPQGHAAFGMDHAPGLPNFDARAVPGEQHDDGLWWFTYHFDDGTRHGRPAQHANIEKYRNIHAVQEAAWRLCMELKHFDDIAVKPAKPVEEPEGDHVTAPENAVAMARAIGDSIDAGAASHAGGEQPEAESGKSENQDGGDQAGEVASNLDGHS